MTTATYHSTGLGQEAWGQPIHPQYGFQPHQQFGQQPPWQQQFGQQTPWQQTFGQQPSWQPQFVSQQQPSGQQILAILPTLFAQQAQQLYALAQMCTQLVSGSSYQMGPSFAGQRPYSMGV
jgi:hypothetical protein